MPYRFYSAAFLYGTQTVRHFSENLVFPFKTSLIIRGYMAFDIRALAIANLAVQLVLITVLSVAFYLAKKRKLKKHCTIMRIAVPAQILVILGIMLPSMDRYIKYAPIGPLFNAEILMHHILGLSVLALWVYINLIFLGFLSLKFRLRTIMRLALTFWVVTLILGLHIYSVAHL